MSTQSSVISSSDDADFHMSKADATAEYLNTSKTFVDPNSASRGAESEMNKANNTSTSRETSWTPFSLIAAKTLIGAAAIGVVLRLLK